MTYMTYRNDMAAPLHPLTAQKKHPGLHRGVSRFENRIDGVFNSVWCNRRGARRPQRTGAARPQFDLRADALH